MKPNMRSPQLRPVPLFVVALAALSLVTVLVALLLKQSWALALGLLGLGTGFAAFSFGTTLQSRKGFTPSDHVKANLTTAISLLIGGVLLYMGFTALFSVLF